MALVTIPGGLWLPVSSGWAAAVPAFFGLSNMNAAATFAAYIFRVPKSGTLDWFEARQHTNTNTPDNGVRFSFQDVTSVGAPDNVEDQFRVITAGFGAGAWLVPPGVMTNDGTSGGTKRTVTKGDFLACVVRFENFVAGDQIAMGGLDNATGPTSSDGLQSYPTTSSNSGTTWVINNPGTALSIALKYSDGTYAVITWPNAPMQTINTRTYNSGTSPDERGLKFQVPASCAIGGMWTRMALSGNVDIVLYDAADNVLSTVSLLAGQRSNATGTQLRVNFASPITLTPNVNYRLTHKPSTTTNFTSYDFDIAAAALLEAMDGGATWMSTNRVDAGAWTDVNTNRPFMGIILDQIEAGGAVGGGGVIAGRGGIATGA